MTLVMRVRTCISMAARVNVNQVSTDQRQFSGSLIIGGGEYQRVAANIYGTVVLTLFVLTFPY